MKDIPDTPNRRWLVTGAAGFIGNNLAAFLMDRGEQVVGLDNFFSGKRGNIDRLERRYGNRFTFFEGDILDRSVLVNAIAGCSAVAHLAAQVSVIRSIDLPDETHEINTNGFLRVMQMAVEAGVENLVYASSCAVYGDQDSLPLTESQVSRPMSPYAASKLANEAYAAGFRVCMPKLKIVGFRFFNIFGPWQDASSGYAAVIPKWIDILLEGRRPVLFGDGSATRDFCYVDDVCQAIWRAVACGAAANGEVFNVASGIATRLDSLYATIGKVLKEAGHLPDIPTPACQPARAGEIRHSFGNPEKAAKVLNFHVEIGLEEGLRRTLHKEFGMEFPSNA